MDAQGLVPCTCFGMAPGLSPFESVLPRLWPVGAMCVVIQTLLRGDTGELLMFVSDPAAIVGVAHQPGSHPRPLQAPFAHPWHCAQALGSLDPLPKYGSAVTANWLHSEHLPPVTPSRELQHTTVV